MVAGACGKKLQCTNTHTHTQLEVHTLNIYQNYTRAAMAPETVYIKCDVKSFMDIFRTKRECGRTARANPCRHSNAYAASIKISQMFHIKCHEFRVKDKHVNVLIFFVCAK